MTDDIGIREERFGVLEPFASLDRARSWSSHLRAGWAESFECEGLRVASLDDTEPLLPPLGPVVFFPFGDVVAEVERLVI